MGDPPNIASAGVSWWPPPVTWNIVLDPYATDNPHLEEDQTGEAYALSKDVVERLRKPGIGMGDVDAALKDLVGLDDSGRSRFSAKDLARFREEALALELDGDGNVIIPS